MKSVKTAITVGMMLFFLIGVSAYAADVAKIGVVDFQKILEASNQGKAGKAEITKQSEKMESDLKKKGAEIEELNKNLEKNAMVGSRESKEEKEREIQIKVFDFKNLEKKYRAELQKLNTDTFLRIQKEVDSIVDEIGKKEGYLIVIERREAGVYYAPASVDITDKVIQQYNAKLTARQGVKEKQ